MRQIFLVAFFTICIACADGARKPVKPLAKSLRCHGCHLVAETVLSKLRAVTEKSKDETVLVGHRMQANRKKARKKAYMGSEAMALDVLEDVCDPIQWDADKLTKSRKYKTDPAMLAERIKSFGLGDLSKGLSGGLAGLEDQIQGGGTGKSLKSYCETVVEEYEEDLKEKMFNQQIKLSKWLCLEEAAVCKADDYDSDGNISKEYDEMPPPPPPPLPPKEEVSAEKKGDEKKEDGKKEL